MSPLFVKEFKNTKNCCPHCRKKGKASLCSKCLTVAKLKYRVWYRARKNKGLCCTCDHRSISVKGVNTGRCTHHRDMNQKRIERFFSRNPNYTKDRYLFLKKKYTQKGLCYKCRGKEPLVPGKEQGQNCLNKHKQYVNNKKMGHKTTKVFYSKRDFMIKEAKGILKTMGIDNVRGIDI